MIHQSKGLSVADHKKTCGLLHRVLSGLRGISSNLQRGYPPDHTARRAMSNAIENMHVARIELESAARREHPDSHVTYPPASPVFTADSISNAVAGQGDGIGQID